jgi:hypothetical protein
LIDRWSRSLIQGSSDGGGILLEAAARRLSLTLALAVCREDDRQPGKVQQALSELIAQRVMAIALGVEDVSDAERLACHPIHKLLVGRDPVPRQHFIRDEKRRDSR